MNTQNFKPIKWSWEEIFQKQRELKFMYEPEARELFDNFDIDCLEDQELFKKYCWRITEEFVEAMEADTMREITHLQEELIDALNFSIELMLLCGMGPDKLICSFKNPSSYFGSRNKDFTTVCIYHLGLTANCLKNRQWRRSQYLVDMIKFDLYFGQYLSALKDYLFKVFKSDEQIRRAWSLKYQVNMFRIQTNY